MLTEKQIVEPVVNNYKPSLGNVITIKEYVNNIECKNLVVCDIGKLLNENKRVVCCVSSKNTAMSIVKSLVENSVITQEDVKLYHGDQLAQNENGVLHKVEKAEDFKDVNECWKSKRLLVYTGTLSCGVDYNPENYNDNFDTFVNIFQESCGYATQFVQSFARCREFKDKQHLLYIQHYNKNCTNDITPVCVYDTVVKCGVSIKNKLNDQNQGIKFYLTARSNQIRELSGEYILSAL